jgi:acetyl esterase/lipase
MMSAMAKAFPTPEDVRYEPLQVGSVPAEWVTAPGADASRAILYLHGGGYAIGSISSHRELAARISRAAGARVLLIDYRLAPEHPFPAAVDDAVAAYRWLVASGLTPPGLAIAGDSAGGGLTVAALVSLRDSGDTLPAAGVCLSPWVDLEGTGASMTERAALDPMVAADRLRVYANAYLGGADPRSPLASPLYADLRGLPPLLIQVGTAETLYDDASRLADRARTGGVEVTFEACQDMIHVWQIFASMLPEGREAIDRIGEFLRAKLA